MDSRLKNFKGDKRSREYKELKDSLASPSPKETEVNKGLGDVVADVIKATGLDKLVEPECEDCKKRQSRLNDWGDNVKAKLSRLFHGRQVTDMSDSDYEFLSEFLKDGMPQLISRADQVKLNSIYFNVSGIKKRPTSCAPCVIKVVSALEVYMNQYKNK